MNLTVTVLLGVVRRDRAVLPAATPVAVAAEEWLGQASEGPVEFRKARSGKLTNRSCRLRNRLNLSHVDRVMRRIKSSGHHHSLSFILLCGGLIVQQIGAVVAAVR